MIRRGLRVARNGRTPVAVVASAAVVVALGACGKNTGTGGGIDNSDLNRTSQGVIATNPKDSQGPAPAVPGAKKGGTLRILREGDYEHLDPQRNYTLPATAIGQLMYRTLTAFREDGKGKLTLVGDLADSAGKDVNNDCKVWEYKLKKGVKFSDGTPIKAADINYAIARSFEENIADGPTYLQQWLADDAAYNDKYQGPYTSGSETVPGLQVVDDSTLRFTFARPHCDMPFAAAQNTTVPVPKARDTKEEYDSQPVSSGPYQIKEYSRDTSLLLERNPNWDRATDPIRHDYPDQVSVEIGPSSAQATNRAMVGNGDDATAVAEDGVPQELVPQALAGNLKNQLINAPSSLVWRLEINNDRIKDVAVRRAIAYALDKKGIMNTFGGDAAGKLTHTVLPPSTIGYREYPNPYDGGDNGSPEKARALLGDKKVKLVMLSRQVDDPYLKAAEVVKQSLEKAGFEVVVTPIVRTDHNPTIKTRGNAYDIYLAGWAPDWPSAASTIPVLYNGKGLGGDGSKGNEDTAYFNEEPINSEIERIGALGANEAAPEWVKLDERIFKEYCPSVPIFIARTFAINGPKVGGVFNSDAVGQQVYYNAYVK
jgi:peptide/nickel transport system substrate-binding protein